MPLDRLVDALWEDEPPATARHAVRVYASNLRKAIGGGIHARGGGYVLEADEEAIDAKRFERLADEGRQLLSAERVIQARETLEQALALWRGPPLAEFEGEWAEIEIARLEELRLAALEARIDADLELGRHEKIVVELEALVAKHPLRERFSAQLMLALYRAGRQADALAVYRRTRSFLADELGLEAGPELRRLERAILDQDPALALEPAEARERRRLPEPATPLVGRRTEIEGVAALLRGDARLVTVVGPGGIGKTRVALEAARELAGAFRHGVLFVGLSAVRDPDLVPAEIASAVGVEDTNGALVEYLRTRDLLLLADNFEQVDDAAPLLGSLLQEASGLKVLITSRHALRLYGEHRFSLPPLTLDQEAVPLFLQRARAAGRAIDVDESVREICRRLDCLPLAIELAAARVAEYSPDELLALLPRSLDLAAEGPRDAPERQRTLRAAIAWSFGLLPERDRTLLAALSVFAGGFASDAAAAISDADDPCLSSLVDKSLLVRDGERFHLLETIREYAAEQLAEQTKRVARSHARWFLELAVEADQVTQGGDQAAWWARLETDHDNLRAALESFEADGDVERELRLVGALWAFWTVYGHINEGRRRLEAALSRGGSRSPTVRGKALHGAGALAYRQGDFEHARMRFEEGLAEYESADEEAEAAKILGELGNIAVAAGKYESALAYYERCGAGLRSAGILGSLGQVIANMGAVASMQRDYERSRVLLEEAIALHRESGNSEGLAVALHNLARVHLRTGRNDDARRTFREALEIALGLRYREVIAHGLEGCAELALARGDAAGAARLIGAAEAMLDDLGIAMSGDDAEMYEATLAALQRELGDDFDRARRAGRELPMAGAVEEALRAGS